MNNTLEKNKVLTENVNEAIPSNDETTEVVNEEIKFVPIKAVDEEGKKIKLTKMERKKLRVMNKLLAHEINGTKAAEMLKISTRQVRNLKRQMLTEGIYGIIHKNHYNKPYNTYEESLRKELAHIYRTKYRGTNFTDFAEIMREQGYDLSRSTVYNILREQHIRSPQRKKKKRKKVETTTTKKTTTKKTTTAKKTTISKTVTE